MQQFHYTKSHVFIHYKNLVTTSSECLNWRIFILHLSNNKPNKPKIISKW